MFNCDICEGYTNGIVKDQHFDGIYCMPGMDVCLPCALSNFEDLHHDSQDDARAFLKEQSLESLVP